MAKIKVKRAKNKFSKRPACEDYLKAIFKLSQVQKPVSTSALASHLGHSAASVTNMVKKLSREGHLTHENYRGFNLTPSGRRIALEMIRHHRLLELFLHQTLGYPWDDVHEEAERLEHHISEQFEEKMFEVLGRPRFDPHGDPIPSKKGVMRASSARALAKASVGENHCIERVSDHDAQLLRYVAKLGLVPRKKIKVVEIAPFQGPFTLQLGRQRLVVGREILKHIYTRVI